ncbi:unnamed protein product [Callosobruchus maculatus]|uniref:Uncharacterized protein n=1 Tax=Callosobruchus maculatus TaxID=64391 RepID=A0A653CY18_CALMS|nr:unnamed protein product [Callosobruchus maculatus]
MKPILLIVTFTAAVSAQNNWRQSRDYLGNNIKLVQNPSYTPQIPINQNQRIGVVTLAQPANLENVFNPNQNQRISALPNTWVPPSRLNNVQNPINQNHGAPPSWQYPANQGNQFNQQQRGVYIAPQQQLTPISAQRRYSTATIQPVSITYSPLQQQEVPKYQQKKQQNYKKQELKKKQAHKNPVYQPQVVYDPFAQNSNQQIQPLPYIPPEPLKQSYQNNPLNQAQRHNNHQRQSYPRNPVTYRYTKKHPVQPKTQAAQASIRSSKLVNHIPKKQTKNPLLKDYRDDKTHEPQADDAQYEREEQEYDREEAEDEPAHEEYEVPTKPIYPGEGQWAIRGKKHRPFIRGDKPVNLEEDGDEVPDGYDTFIQGQKVFEKTKADLSKQFDQVPMKHGLGKYLPESSKGDQFPKKHGPGQYLPERSEEDEDAKEDQFVPVRLYAQVRHSEDEKHLPRSAADDERLKELVKDSKIHTVYTEEGYEDDAYDHAGHEKNAETGEAFEEAGKLHDRKIVKKIPDKILEQTKKDSDSEDAGSSDSSSSASQETKNSSNDTVKNDYLSTKQNKVITAKEANDGSVKMEVEGEVKVVLKPENSTKVKQYSKPLPKVHKNLKAKHDSEGKASLIEEKVLKKKIGKGRPASLPATTATTEDIGEILTEDIPATTSGTTAIPKRRNEIKVATVLSLGKEEQPFLEVSSRKRRKRGAFDGNKYPYYRANALNPNSPLRYSEDLRNIPDKTRDDLAFYRQAETRFRCPEVDRSVDPVPDKVKEKVANEGQEEDEEDEENSDPSNHKRPSKRLNQLGDKIDCLKVQYFGVNPFDSPFFSESEVGPVRPVLNFNEKLSTRVSSPPPAFSKEPYIKEQLRHLPVVATILPTEYQGEPYSNEQLREHYVKQQLRNLPIVVLPTAVPKEQYTEEQLKDLRNQYSEEQLKQLQEEYFKTELKKLNIPYMKEEFDRIESPYVTKQTNQFEIPYRKEHSGGNTIVKDKPKASQTSANTISLRKVKINPKVALHSTSEDIYNDDETIEENEVFSASEPRQNVIQMGTKETKGDSKIFIKEGQAPLETTTESVSLLTTPKYTIDLKPKHIYHQIELLGYLPGEDDINQNATSRMDQVVEHREEPKTNESVRVVITLDENKRKPKIYIEEVAPKFTVNGGAEGVGRAQAVRRIRIKQKRPSSSRDHAPKSAPSKIVIPLHGSEPTGSTEYRPLLPYSLPYATQRPYVGSNPYSSNYQQASYQDRIKVRIVRPTFQIFDINKFLPTTEAPLFGSLDMYGEGSAPLPKYKIVSEVYYKDEIKPNEQLMLLADVMNHIRNSSIQPDDSSKDSSETIPVTLKNINGNKATTQQVDRGFYEVGTTNPTSTSTSTTPTANSVRKEIDGPYMKRPGIRRVKYRKKKLRPTTTTTTTTKLPEESTEIASTTEVIDMKPPAIKGYNSNKMNKYYVQGMRPPPRQKLFMYSDYLKNELNRNRQRLHRSRRSAAKYAELSRSRVRGTATTSQPDSDDYVPNRTRNWHYDDKTGKIVYHSVPKPEEDKEVEVIYEEVTEPVIPLETQKPKQNPIFATATPPPEGQSYIDFVKKLKSAASYKLIPDPTTTEKSDSMENIVSTTLKPLSTTPPEFLSILSKVKSNSAYKLIEDDKDKKKTTTTTEAAEPESSESQEENVQNSPGGIAMNNFQIFDITDYIPKTKHYLPVTGVDTSKYTTIQRPKTDIPKSDQEKENEKSEDVVQSSSHVDSQVTADKGDSTRTTPASIARTTVSSSSTVVAITSATTTPTPATFTSGSDQIIDVDSTTGSSDSSRRRRRRKRRRKIIGQSNNSTSIPVESQENISSEKPQFNNRRRAVQASTEKFIFDNIDNVTKSLVRRSDNSDTRFQRLYEIDQPSISKVESKREDVPSKKDDTKKENMYVVILQPYDPNAKTGGNYMEELLTGEIATQKPSQESNEKPVEVFQPYDPNQKTGGNYKAAPVSNITESALIPPNSRKYVEVFQQYDPGKKTGGNYRAANSYNVQKTALPETAVEPKQYVEVFQQYDPNKKTGGNYKTAEKEKLVVEDIAEDVTEVVQPTDSSQNTGKEARRSEADIEKNIDVFQPYDPSQKHGGNYRLDPKKSASSSVSVTNTEELGTLEEPVAEENQHNAPKKYREAVAAGTKTTEGPLVINLLRNFDKPDELTDRGFDLKNRKRKNKKTTKGKDSVTRLADVIPKPESYYTDPNLPKAVNMLMEVNLPNEEIEKIVEGKDSSAETVPKKYPTKAELSRAKVSRKSYKKAKELAITTTTVKPESYGVTEVTSVDGQEVRDQFEERKEAEESRTVTEKQRIDDIQERSEPDVEEMDAVEPYDGIHHVNGNETKSSFKEEYTPLDDDHDHEDEIEDMTSEEEETSITEKPKNLPPIIKDPSKRLYYYLPA